MEKAFKIAHAKLWVWKMCTQNMCKKCPKSCKISKNAQNCTKKTKTFNKTREKTQKLTQLWKISTRGAAAGAISFHPWSQSKCIIWIVYFVHTFQWLVVKWWARKHFRLWLPGSALRLRPGQKNPINYDKKHWKYMSDCSQILNYECTNNLFAERSSTIDPSESWLNLFLYKMFGDRRG